MLNVPGIDIDYRLANSGSTALHGAAYSGREECVALLLAKGARPDIRNLNDVMAADGLNPNFCFVLILFRGSTKMSQNSEFVGT